MLLKARWIVPVTAPPIENGWVRVEDGMIVEIHHSPSPLMGEGQGGGDLEATLPPTPSHQGRGGKKILDLGDSVLLPGLINCHAHLEFERKDRPADSFAAWAQSVQEQQAKLDDGTRAEIWQHNVQRLLATGTTTVVNHVNHLPPSPLMGEGWGGGDLEATLPPTPSHQGRGEKTRCVPHLLQICEIVGSSAERAAESYRQACEQRLKLLESDACEDAVTCPTSLYAVSPLVWENFLQNRDRSDLLSLHFKESAEEEALFLKGRGPLATLVKEREGMLWQSDPMKWLRKKELLEPNTLLIHGNYLTDADITTLQGTGTSVIHCPGSHAYFGHQRFPLEALLERKINVALGTDSLASNSDLSMLEEMRRMQEAYPHLSFAQIVEMATLAGAKALGLEERRGSLEVGKEADLIAVKMMAEEQSPWEAIAKAEIAVFAMVGGGSGKWRLSACKRNLYGL